MGYTRIETERAGEDARVEYGTAGDMGRVCRRSGKPPTLRANKATNGDKNVAKMHDVAELTLLKGDVLK